jgi:hypothetical protein
MLDEYPRYRLLLRPLSAISDEHAITVAMMMRRPYHTSFDVENLRVKWSPTTKPNRFLLVIAFTGKAVNTAGHDDSQDYIIHITSWGSITAYIGDGVQRSEWCPINNGQFITQYLIQQGYAVPLFIAPGHPDNGKTAIELGLAEALEA